MANAVCGSTRKSNVRNTRSKILLLLLALACPVDKAPRKAWYVPGAVARLGAEGIQRAWRGFYGEEPPSLRSMRSHLGELELAVALVRAPGDWQPRMRDPEHPERRPRYPNTLILVTEDTDADWWEQEGRYQLAAHPEVRANPDQWRRMFGRWRERAARLVREPRFTFDGAASAEAIGGVRETVRPIRETNHAKVEPTTEDRETASTIARAATEFETEPLALLARLREAGVDVRGPGVQLSLARAPRKLAGAAMMLARAIMRGDRVRNKAGWLVRVFTHARELRKL